MWMPRRPPVPGGSRCGESSRTLISERALLLLAWDTTVYRHSGKVGRRIAEYGRLEGSPLLSHTRTPRDTTLTARLVNIRIKTVYPSMRRTSRAFTIPSR